MLNTAGHCSLHMLTVHGIKACPSWSGAVHQNNSYCRSQLQCMHTLWDHKDLVLSSDLEYSQVKISLLLLQQPVKQHNVVNCPAQMVFSGTREDARFAGVDNVSQLVSSHCYSIWQWEV